MLVVAQHSAIVGFGNHNRSQSHTITDEIEATIWKCKYSFKFLEFYIMGFLSHNNSQHNTITQEPWLEESLTEGIAH